MKDWYLISDNSYLSGYELEEFSDNAISAFEEILNNSPESYIVTINNKKKIKAIIQSKSSVAIERKMHTHIDEVCLGDLVDHKNKKWLVVDFVDDNKMHSSTTIKLCNSTFPIKYNKRKVLLTDDEGNPILDQLGRPVYREEYEVEKDEPCVVETKTTNSLLHTGQIQLPNGQIQIILKYQPSDTIKLNYEFEMFNDPYKIIDIDYTNVIQNKGVVIIRAKRDQEV
jgi:hypothetical protein